MKYRKLDKLVWCSIRPDRADEIIISLRHYWYQWHAEIAWHSDVSYLFCRHGFSLPSRGSQRAALAVGKQWVEEGHV